MEKSKAVIPYGRQDISQADIDAVVDVLRSDFLTQGPNVHEFEHSPQNTSAPSMQFRLTARPALCTSYDVDWISDREMVLWTMPITFIAIANYALYFGAG